MLIIVLAGGLVYLLSSASRSERPPVVASKPALPPSAQTTGDHEQTPDTAIAPERAAGEAMKDDHTPGQPAAQRAPALEPEIREALGRILNTSSEGLVEVTTDKGTSVDLQGRFQTAPVATIDENGKATIVDYSTLPKEPSP